LAVGASKRATDLVQARQHLLRLQRPMQQRSLQQRMMPPHEAN
jgi:hypothetical protein